MQGLLHVLEKLLPCMLTNGQLPSTTPCCTNHRTLSGWQISHDQSPQSLQTPFLTLEFPDVCLGVLGQRAAAENPINTAQMGRSEVLVKLGSYGLPANPRAG